MKKKARFNSERAILAEIHQCERDSAQCLKDAESMEADARELFKHPDMVADAHFKMEEVAKLRRRAARLIDVKARNLGLKLAEFRTETLPFLTDKTVQAP